MTDPTDATGVDARASRVVQRFLAAYFDDEERGEVGGLADYQARFPGHDDTLAAAWRGLTSATPDAAPASWAGRTIGPYVLGELLGEGGQGVVHAARDTRLQRTVAVKLLRRRDAADLDRFRREAELAARVDHPGLCTVFDAGVVDDFPYLVMPRVDGPTLAERIARGGPLAPDDAAALVEAVARALHVAHAAGVVHRDIKPGNIVVRDDGSPVLMDFGVARDLDVDARTLTSTGELVGTLPYMAPEQLDGRPITRATDVYALGVVLYECLTGELPFGAPTQRGLLDAIVRDEPPDLRRVAPHVPRDLAVVVAVALDKDPARRMRGADVLADELRRVLERRPIASRPSTATVRLTRWLRREPRVAASLGAAFVLLVGGLVTALVLLDRVDEERDAKDVALVEMRTERDAKQLALDEIAVLADHSRLDALLAELDAFVAPGPDDVEALDAWIARADELVARLDVHRAALDALEAVRRPVDEAERAAFVARDAEQERRAKNVALAELLDARVEAGEGDAPLGAAGTVRDVRDHALAVVAEIDTRLAALEPTRFDDERDAWRHGLETDIVAGLEALAADDPFAPTLRRARDLRAFAARVEHDSLVAPAAAWQRAIADVAADPRFDGFTLTPQLGLVPLGADPDSRLHEFAHLLTGAPPTRDSETGALVCGEETGLVFVLVPGGRTIVGAEVAPAGKPFRDPGALPGETPPALVDLSPYLIAKHEMTQGQWLRATGHNPSTYVPGKQYDAAPITLWHPVESVSWETAVDVLGRLGLTLPTSAQWEAAARGGSTTVYPWGDTVASGEGRFNVIDRAMERVAGRTFGAATAPFDDGFSATAPPASFPPNGFGLHEVLGNVSELVLDEDHRNETPRRPGDGRVLLGDPRMIGVRGGSSRSPPTEARCAMRTRQPPDLVDVTTGVRPVFPLER